jgi:hypothetical protein
VYNEPLFDDFMIHSDRHLHVSPEPTFRRVGKGVDHVIILNPFLVRRQFFIVPILSGSTFALG